MKIGLLFASLKIGGGVEKAQSDMSQILTALWHECVHILSEDLTPKHPHDWRIISLQSPFIKGFWVKKIIRLFSDARKVKHICETENIDLLIGQGDYFYMISGLVKMLWYPGKTLAVVHTTIGIWNITVQKILRFFLKKHDAIIMISEEEKRIFEQQYHFPTHQLHYIPNSIDTTYIRKRAIEKVENIDFSRFTYINIGRLTHQKGHKRLLEAFDIFWKQHNNTQLLILGDGELRCELQDFVSTLSSKNHIFFLWNQENPYKFLTKSHCFVFSSHFEGFGLALLEAMTCGIPIISTDCPTWPAEILQNGKCGILVNNTDNTVDDLADAMKTIYSHPDIAKKCTHAGQNRVQEFSREAITKQWKRFLENIER